jgi:hypothetical protein
MDSHEELQTVSSAAPGRKVAVPRFTATKPGQTEIGCHAVGPIKSPDGEPFAEYIRKALIDQLRLAQLYSQDGAVHVYGNLDQIDFSSPEGISHLMVTLSDNANRSFVVNEDYDYQSSFYGETACNQQHRLLCPQYKI